MKAVREQLILILLPLCFAGCTTRVRLGILDQGLDMQHSLDLNWVYIELKLSVDDHGSGRHRHWPAQPELAGH